MLPVQSNERFSAAMREPMNVWPVRSKSPQRSWLASSGGPSADFSTDLRDDLYVGVERVHDAVAAGEELVILDARPGSDYLAGHISGSISVPFYRMSEALPLLPQDRWIVTYCGCPHMLSGEAAADLQAAGFTLVAVLDEGYYTWLGAGYATTSGPSRY